MHLVSSLFKPLHFERQYGEHLIHIPLDVLDAILFPSPNLGTDVIEHLADALAMHILGYVEVEPWIIHQDQHVRLPLGNVSLALSHVSQDDGQMHQHRDETHISHFFVVLHHRSSHRSHLVATIETELSRRILLLQLSHQIRGVQVARSLSRYQIILHI